MNTLVGLTPSVNVVIHHLVKIHDKSSNFASEQRQRRPLGLTSSATRDTFSQCQRDAEAEEAYNPLSPLIPLQKY